MGLCLHGVTFLVINNHTRSDIIYAQGLGRGTEESGDDRVFAACVKEKHWASKMDEGDKRVPLSPSAIQLRPHSVSCSRGKSKVTDRGVTEGVY